LKRIITSIIVLFPILSVYETMITKVSYGDALLVMLFPFVLLYYVKKRVIQVTHPTYIIGILFIYIFISFLFQLNMGTGVEILSTIRYLLYLFYLIIILDFFEFNYGVRVLEIVSIAVSLYVLVQFVYFFVFANTLPWHISFLKVIDQNFILLEQRDYFLDFYRPTGVFMEPTHFAQYVAVYLSYLLLYDLKNKISFIKSSIVTLAILACGSSLGLIFLMIVWLMWFILRKKSILSPFQTMLLLVSMFVFAQFIFSFDYFEKIVSRMITDGSFSGAAAGYRFNSLDFLKSADRTLLDWLIGTGRGTEQGYFTGVFYLLANNGILGVLIYLWLIVFTFINNNHFTKWFVIIVFILSIGSEFIVNFGILFYFSFIFSSSKHKEAS